MKTRTFNMAAVAAAFGLGAAAFAFPAHAADLVGEEPPAPPAPAIEAAPVSDWAGGYAGVTGAYEFGKVQSTQPANQRHINDGYRGSVFGGFNMQNGQFVYGAEADAGYGTTKGNNASNRSDIGLDGSIRARAGVAVTNDVLVYGTGGLAAADMSVREGGKTANKVNLGYTVGAGTDVKITDQVFARGEYRYTDYGTETFRTGSGANKVSASENRISLGLGVKF
ncbi:MAG: porin family protein [Notoacmeibacter sp.]|nr:porin family protein [Notoacmeibacter sp.]